MITQRQTKTVLFAYSDSWTVPFTWL